MALLPKQANTEENSEGLGDRTALPAGSYLAHIVKSEMKQTKAKTGHYLSLHFTVLEGEKKGRMFFANLNLDNPNPIAVEIANKELNSICQACDLQGVEDSDELHQIPMLVTLKVDAATAQWPEGNSITAYADAGEFSDGGDDDGGEAIEAELVEVEGEDPATVAEPDPEGAAAADAGKLPWE